METTNESSSRINMLPTRAFIALLFAGLLLRILVLPASGFQTDVVMWQNWALKIRHLGIEHVYDPVAFLENSRAPLLLVDHPPVNLYYLTFVAHLPFNSPYIHPLFNALIKFPGVLFDCFVVLLLVAIARALQYPENVIRFIALLYWLNPGFMYHHSFWGLNESMSACVFLGTLLLLLRKRDALALVVILSSLALKAQMMIFIPIVYAVVVVRDFDPESGTGLLRGLMIHIRRRAKTLLVGTLGGVGVLLFVYIPFIASGTLAQAIGVFSSSVGRFPNLTKGAYNLWFILDGLTGFAIPDTVNFVAGATPRMVGIVLFGIATLVNVTVLIKSCVKKHKLQTESHDTSRGSPIGIMNYELLIFSFVLQGFSFFILPTEMHERYIFYAVTFLPLIAWKSAKYYALYGVLGFTYLVNLVLVYNYFHINWPQATMGHYVVSILNVICYGYLWNLYVRQSKSQKVESL